MRKFPYLLILILVPLVVISSPARASVLLVCNGSTAPCPAGASYSAIQSAVNAAQPGDWILVWPGVYHEKGTDQAGVYVTTPNLHIRGLDRNLVIVDGSNGTNQACPSNPAAQDFGPLGAGRNGIEVYKTDGVTVENLTVCNYLSSNGGTRGNEIWWNGGDGSGQMGMHSYWGAFLTATSTYFRDANSAQGQYGIFVSNAGGPQSVASWITDSYASNMGDSGFYVGACADCNTTLSRVHSQHNSLGFSGTNGGGRLIIENSEWDDNKTGVAPNTLNNDDAPSPQSGLCPPGVSPPPGAPSCTVLRGNYVHDNNNPNVPAFGISGSAPVGVGIELSAGQFDTVINNTVANQGSWGIVIHDYPDTGPPPPVATCSGGISGGPTGVCYFQAKGNEVTGNLLMHNGSFGNPTNGDLANAGTGLGNCFAGNSDPYGLTSAPPLIQVVDSLCQGPTPGDEGLLVAQLVCASEIFGPCPDTPVTHYPRATNVTMLPLTKQPRMQDPCASAPANPWCPYSGPSS